MPPTLYMLGLLLCSFATADPARSPATGPSTTIIRLSWERLAELVRSQGPAVQVAEAALQQVRASRVGADIYTQQNPTLSASASRHWPDKAPSVNEWVGRLAWPLDVSGAYRLRAHVADLQVDAAEHRLVVAQRGATFAAMDLVLRVRAAADLRDFHARRHDLDDELVAEAWRRQGLPQGEPGHGGTRPGGLTGVDEVAPHHAPIGNDVALVHLLRSQQRAARQRAAAEEIALMGHLRRQLGLDPGTSLEVPESLEALPPPPPRPQLLTLLDRRPEYATALAQLREAQAQVSLQVRLGLPQPSASLWSGRVPETFGTLQLDVPLPIFQRNQTQRATARAAAHTAALRAALLQQQMVTDFLGAYAMWEGEAAALDALNESQALAGEAERYAQQGYLSGRDRVTSVVVARRESTQAYQALVAARLSAARARLALALAAGEEPDHLAQAASAETP